MALTALTGFLSTISTEPVALAVSLAGGVKYGAGIESALLFEKVCRYKLDYPEYVCNNLSAYEDQNYRVQEVVNEFGLYKSMMACVLTTFTSLFTGAFADKYGLRTLITWSLVVTYVAEAIDYLNYTFLEELPLEFLYLDVPVQALKSGYYMALYGIISRYAAAGNLASRMAFLDGVVNVAFAVSTAPSAVIFRAVGYYGVYGISTGLITIGFVYHLFFVRNYPRGHEKEELDSKKKSNVKTTTEKVTETRVATRPNLIQSMLVEPVKDLFTTLLKPRPNHMRPMLLLCFLGMILYYTALQELMLIYPYMLLVFEVTPEEYATFNVASSVVTITSLFALMPLMTKVFKWHETVMLSLVLIPGAIFAAMSAFADNIVPGFIITFSLAQIRYLCFPCGRSFLTKLVKPEEVPKMYGFLNLVTQVVNLSAIPLFRMVYDSTLKVFPSAFLVLSAGLNLMAGLIFMLLMTQLNRLRKFEREREVEKTELKKIDAPPLYDQIAKSTAL
jgi:MFS family permease